MFFFLSLVILLVLVLVLLVLVVLVLFFLLHFLPSFLTFFFVDFHHSALHTSVLDRRRAVYTPIPADQGPFSLGDEQQTIDLLVSAGWVDVRCSMRRDALYLRGPATLEQAVKALIESNSEQGVLVGQPREIIEEARTALIEGLAPWHDGTGISLPGGFLMITATRH